MKRSEALKIISKGIFRLYENKFTDELAEQLLTELEEAGMLPPEIVTDSSIDTIKFVTNEWEPEDGS